MIKKLLMFIFFVSAIVTCIFIALCHIDMYKALAELNFSGWENIKASIANIIMVIGDFIIVLSVVITFIGFLIHLLNTQKGNKKVIKCTGTIGSYFIIFMVVSFIASIIRMIGESGFVDFIKETVMEQSFYLPLALNIVAAIFFGVARAIKRGGIAKGILVTIGVGLAIFINIKWFNTTRVNSVTTMRFLLIIITCGLAVIPSFIPDLNLLNDGQ